MSNESEQLVKRYFGFLVEDYGFEYYDLYSFRSDKMLIQVLPGHKTPRIDINKIEELDLYKLNFEWIMKFFHGTFPSESHDYLKHSLEKNMIFISKVFRENSRRLIEELDIWWIPVHVFCYHAVEQKFRDSGQIARFQKSYKYYYDYLKGKVAI